MKRKIYFIITILILSVILCTALVGCAPSRPDRYITQLLASENWGVFFYNENGEETSVIARNGNMRMDIGVKGSTCLVIGKTAVEVYRFEDNVWSYQVVVDKDKVQLFKEQVLNGNANNLDVTAPDLLYIQNDFESKFEKINGKWYERNTKPACVYTKNNCLIYEKNNKTTKYKMGYKIVLPKEAKQAKKDALAS